MSCPPATPRASTRESKPLALAVGTRLGAYEVIGLLGSGGMGDVYRARDPRLGRVYRLLAKYGGDDEANAYLQRAAEAFTRAMTLDTDSTVAHNLYTAFEVESEGRAVDATVRLIGRLRDRPDPELFAGLVLSCRFCGLLDASVAADRQARRLDPAIRTSIMYTHFARGDWEQAIATDVEDARWVTKYALLVLGRPDEAMASFRETENRPLPVLLRRLMMVSRLALEGRRDECVAASRAFTAAHVRSGRAVLRGARVGAHRRVRPRPRCARTWSAATPACPCWCETRGSTRFARMQDLLRSSPARRRSRSRPLPLSGVPAATGCWACRPEDQVS